MFAVVLVHPEIPPNTGNVIRLTANTATELHPLLASIDVEPPRLRCHRLGLEAGIDRAQAAIAFELVLVELLSVLGTLTAEILTPALHEALADAAAGRDQASIPGSDAP